MIWKHTFCHCQTYNRLGKNACVSHKIEARDLYNLVLSDIQEVAAMALKDKEAFSEADGRNGERTGKQPEPYAGNSSAYQRGGIFRGRCADDYEGAVGWQKV